MMRKEVDINKLSPGMKQYMDIKDQYTDELLFYFAWEIFMNYFLKMEL